MTHSNQQSNSSEDLKILLMKFGEEYEFPYRFMKDMNRSPADQQTEARVALLAETIESIYKVCLPRKQVEADKIAMLKRIMDSRDVHSAVTNGHIHVKNVDYEYWKLTGEKLL